MKHYIVILITTILFACSEQINLPVQEGTPYPKCDTDRHCEQLLKDPAYRAQFEYNKEKYKQIEAKTDCEEVMYVALAFHVTDTTVADNRENRLCLERVFQEQVDLLNADFAATNKEANVWKTVSKLFPDTESRPTCIQFVIADKNHPTQLMKQLEEGRPAITIGEYPHGQIGVGAWAGYLNVWVYPIQGNILGFSPLGGRGIGDGVAINSFAIGGEGNCGAISSLETLDRGRTLSHEIGHFFFLFHIWGEGCEKDDGVADTPDSQGPNWGCPDMNRTTCGSRDLHMNYMDYTNDECMYMFSAGQSTRMEAYVKDRLQNLLQKAPTVSSTFDIEEPEGPTEEEPTEEPTDNVDEEETPPTPPTDNNDNEIPTGILALLIAGILGLIAWIFGNRPDVKDAVEDIVDNEEIITLLNNSITTNHCPKRVAGIKELRFQKGRTEPLSYPLTKIPNIEGGKVVCPKIGDLNGLKPFDFNELEELYNETVRARMDVLNGVFPQWLMDKWYPFEGEAPKGITPALQAFGLSETDTKGLCDIVHMDRPDDVSRWLCDWLSDQGVKPANPETEHIAFLESIPDAYENIADGTKYGLHKVFEAKWNEGVPRPEEIYEYLTGKDGKIVTAYPEGCPKHPEDPAGHEGAAAGGGARLLKHVDLSNRPDLLKVVLDTEWQWGMFRVFAFVHYPTSVTRGLLISGLAPYVRKEIKEKYIK